MRKADDLVSTYRNPYLSDSSDFPHADRIVSWEDIGIPSKPTIADVGKSSPPLVITDVTFRPSKFVTEYGRKDRAFFRFYLEHRPDESLTTLNGTMAEALCQRLASFNRGRRHGEPVEGYFTVRVSGVNPDRAVIDLASVDFD